MKSFKIIKEFSGLSWCHYFFPKLGFKKRPPVRFSNTGNTPRHSKPTSHQNSNSQFSGNHRFQNQNKKDKSSSNSEQITKKNFYNQSNQSNRPDVKHLIAGLKSLLEQFM
ncbi:hypothetical protein RCL_jg28073.t1 [Rhizophagus clarus]|nr:hypothetical protein RCL_jg28073.t1 [Rhizophagus clarus]